MSSSVSGQMKEGGGAPRSAMTIGNAREESEETPIFGHDWFLGTAAAQTSVAPPASESTTRKTL